MLSKMHTITFVLILVFYFFQMACHQVQEQEKTNHKTDAFDVNQLTVNNFHPVSLYNIPKTEIVTAKYPVVDFHTHPYEGSEAEIRQWVKTMDEAGIAKSVIMSYETGSRFDSRAPLFIRSMRIIRTVLFCSWFGETAPIPRYVKLFFQRYQDRLLYITDMGMTCEMYRMTFPYP